MVTMTMISRGNMPSGEQMFKVFQELNAGTDRAAAIVGGSVVEEALRNALECHLHRNKKLTDNLFRPSGALGSFATKIELGYLVGIYGEKGLPHRLDIDGFETATIRDRVMNLSFGERYTLDLSKPIEEKRGDPSRPFGEWPWWFSIQNKDEMLKSPRERFLASVGALTYALSVPLHSAMPRPEF